MKSIKLLKFFLLSAITLRLGSPALFAASGNWNADSAGNWSDATKWSSNPTVPGTVAGDTVGLKFNLTAARTVTLDTPATVGTLNIGDPTSGYFAYTLSTATAQTLTFDNSGGGASLVQATTTASDVISTPITLADNLTVNNSSTLTLSGLISGSGKSITKSTGTGTLVLNNGSSTFDGGVTLNNAGRLAVGASSTPTSGTVTSGPLGTGTLTLNGGLGFYFTDFFTLANNVNVTGAIAITTANGKNDVLNGNFSGNGNLTFVTPGTTTGMWQFGGDNSGYTGTFTQNSGNTSLQFNSANSGSASAAWVFNNSLAERTRLNFGTGTISFGSLSGNGALANVGTSGSSATVQVGALGTSTTFNGFLKGTSSSGGIISGLTKVGTGALTLTPTGTSSDYTGDTTVENGSLIAGAAVAVSTAGPFGKSSAAIALGDATTISSATAMNPKLLIGGAFTMARPVTVGANNNSLGNASTTFTLGGSTANSSTFSGAITLSQNLAVTQVASGTVNITGGISSGASGTQTVTVNNSGPVNIGTGAIGGGIGTIALTKTGAGTLTLTGTHTYTGATTVNQGTLEVATAGTGIASGSAVTVNSTGTLLVDSGATVGSSTVTVSGGTVGGAGTISGATTINSSGALTPRPSSSATTTTFGGNLTLASASANFTLSTTAAGANDKVNFGSSSTLTVDNTDTINITGTTFDIGTDYTLFTSTGGTVSMATTPTLKVNGVTSDQTSTGQYKLVISGDGHSLLLHYIQAATPPTVNSASALPTTSLGHYQTTTLTVNVTPVSGQSITSVTVTVDGLAGAGDPVTLTGPGGDGTGNWTGTFTAGGNTAAGSYTISGAANQSDAGAASWSVTGITVTNASPVWGGGGSDNKWSTLANWNSGSGPAPGIGDGVAFAGSTQVTNNLDHSVSIVSLTFNSGAGSFDITNAASTLTLTGGLTNNSTSTQKLDVPVALSGTPTINAAAGNVALNGAVSDSGSGLITAGSSTTVTLAGVNTYTGPTTIGTGNTLLIGGAGRLGSGTYSAAITNNGALNDGSSASQTLSGVIYGTGSLVNSGSGTLTLSAANSYSGGTVVSSGTLNLTVGGSTGTIRGSLDINSGGTVNLTVQDALGYGGGACVTNVNIAGGVLNNGVNANNGYIANINLAGGAMTSSGGGAFNFSTGYGISSSASSVTSTNSAPVLLRGNGLTFTVAPGTTPSGIDLVNSGAIGYSSGGSGGVTKAGTGTLLLSGTSTYTGPTTVSAGTLLVNGSTASGSAVTVANATLGGSGTINGSVTVNSGGTLAPGTNGVGTLNLGSGLTLNADAISSYTLGTSSTTAAVTGNLALNGTLNVTAGAGFGVGTYTLATYTGTLSGAWTLGTTPAGYSYAVNTSTAGQVNLVVGYLTVSPASYAFGSVATNATSQATFTITNSSGTTINGTASVGTTAFSIVSGSPFSVAAGSTATVTVQFAPTAPGSNYTDTVQFTSGAPTVNVPVTGTGLDYPVADFSGTPTTGYAPLPVTFTDTSYGGATNRFWDFGDGSTTNTLATTVQHTYARSGRWTVTLVTANQLGASTNSKPDYIITTAVLRVLTVGDSITAGASVPSYIPGGYRLPLYRLFTNLNYNVIFTGTTTANPAPGLTFYHEGHGSATIAGVNALMEGVFDNTDDPDIILLLLGTNDYGTGHPDGATNRLDAMISNLATNRPNAKIIVANLLIRTDSTSLDTQIQTTFNPFIPGIVAAHAALGQQVYFTDMRSAVTTNNLSDGLHPTATGYAQMATNWFTAVTNLFGVFGSTNAPVIARVTSPMGLTNVAVTFSKPVADSAANIANFSLSGGVTISAAVLDVATRRVVTLTTSPLTKSASYTLTVTNIVDITDTATPIAPNTTATFTAAAMRGATNNVAEAAHFQLAYSLDIPNAPSYPSNVTYTVDNHASLGAYGRVAYYMELQSTNAGPLQNVLQYVWVSMNPFTTNINKIGIPTVASGAVFQQPVTNMNVASSMPGIASGTGLNGGNLQFWPYNYSIDATTGVYDWNDVNSGSGSYGSMKIANTNASQMLLSFNRWGGNGGNADLGIGNNRLYDHAFDQNNAHVNALTAINPDWTFLTNAANYSVKTLQVFIQPDPVPGVTNISAVMGHPRIIAASDLAAIAGNPANYPLTVTAVSATSTNGSSVILGGGNITYTPSTLGADAFTYTLSDGNGGTAIGGVNVTVSVNHPPVAGNMVVTRNAGINSLRITISDLLTNVTDADGDSITLVSTGTSTNGIVLTSLDTNYLGYFNTNNVNDQFSYTVTDGFGGTNTGLVSIVVSNVATGQITGLFTSFTGGVANLVFHGIPNYSYITERSTNLTDWVDVVTNSAATNGVISVTDSFGDLGNVPPASAYYRLKWQP